MIRNAACAYLCALVLCSCGGNSVAPPPADASVGADATSAGDARADETGADGGSSGDAGTDGGAVECANADAGMTLDASARFEGSCANGCPPGTICTVEIGGVAGGGGEYCAPIPDACRGDVTCACLASCVCGPVDKCANPSDASQGAIMCDNGIR
jgi:hypothetical protein